MVLRRRAKRRQVTLEQQPDDLPKHGLFTEPVRVTKLEVLPLEPHGDGTTRVTFLIEVKDADDKRCSDLAVDARVTGPERTATVQATTDLFGRVRVRMSGPAGDYAIEILEVAAKGLRWDAVAGPLEVAVAVPSSVHCSLKASTVTVDGTGDDPQDGATGDEPRGRPV